MDSWQLQDAKAKFSEVVKMAGFSPQMVTVRGREEVIILSKKHYDRLTKKKPSLAQLLARAPMDDKELRLRRDRSPERPVEL